MCIRDRINTSDEELAKRYRCEVVESNELTDSVEIYRYKFYDNISKDYEINVDGNNISVKDYLGNVTIYLSVPFISNNQIEEYLVNFPERVYKIYIPQGMEYSFQ
jgi:hypothetical protein